jgi:hypothetical protein
MKNSGCAPGLLYKTFQKHLTSKSDRSYRSPTSYNTSENLRYVLLHVCVQRCAKHVALEIARGCRHESPKQFAILPYILSWNITWPSLHKTQTVFSEAIIWHRENIDGLCQTFKVPWLENKPYLWQYTKQVSCIWMFVIHVEVLWLLEQKQLSIVSSKWRWLIFFNPQLLPWSQRPQNDNTFYGTNLKYKLDITELINSMVKLHSAKMAVTT